jgi:hypothetical protein
VVTVLVELGAYPVHTAVVHTAVVLAQEPAPPPDKGPEFGEASPIALVVTILLGISLVFLLRSMTKHLRRVPASFDPPEERPDSPSRPADAETPPER